MMYIKIKTTVREATQVPVNDPAFVSSDDGACD